MDVNELEQKLKELDEAIAGAENSAQAYALILEKFNIEQILSRID